MTYNQVAGQVELCQLSSCFETPGLQMEMVLHALNTRVENGAPHRILARVFQIFLGLFRVSIYILEGQQNFEVKEKISSVLEHCFKFTVQQPLLYLSLNT